MSEQPLTISIVTPSFNQAAYLEETLKSVLDEGYPALEYVVIDGGSTDGSADILRRYGDRFAYWASERDDGHADGIAKGFAHTSGEIMAWINSSDVYYPWTLHAVDQVFRDVPQAEWIVGVSSDFSRTGGPRSITSEYWNVYDFLAGHYRWVQQESVFWRRSLWDRAGGLDTSQRYACDFALWLRFMKLAPLYHVPTVLAAFRYHERRRGATEDDAYGREARVAWEVFRRTASPRDRRRAALVTAMGGQSGRVLRRGLGGHALLPWYRHERIAYDFGTERWRVT